MTILMYAAIAILVWVFVYTVSYGAWTWKRKNKFGAVMVYIAALAELCLPVYYVLFRH